MEAIPLANSSNPLYCDTSTGTKRPLVPLIWRRTVFDSLHGLSHPGIRATLKLITARFVWPGINADVRHWTHSCVQCQHAKIHRHTTAPLSSFPTLDARFDVIHIDVMGLLPPSQGFTYLVTCVDRFSTIITDRGRQFVSQLWEYSDDTTWFQMSTYYSISPPNQRHG